MPLMQSLRRRLLPPQTAIESYENEELVDTVYRKTVAYEPMGTWPLVEHVKAVLDFGGGAGLHYKLARQTSPAIRWAVVETPAMVQRAKELATERLMFFERIEQAANWLGSVELVHSNGAIQYVPDAISTIRSLCAVRPAAMVWRRVPISDNPRREVQTSYLSDNGPGKLPASVEKLVRYERTWISGKAFIDAHGGFQLIESGPDPAERGTQQFRFARAAAVPTADRDQ